MYRILSFQFGRNQLGKPQESISRRAWGYGSWRTAKRGQDEKVQVFPTFLSYTEVRVVFLFFCRFATLRVVGQSFRLALQLQLCLWWWTPGITTQRTVQGGNTRYAFKTNANIDFWEFFCNSFETLDILVKNLDVGGITRLALDQVFTSFMLIASLYWVGADGWFVLFQVKKNRREEAVLYYVCPRHIADALVAGRKVKPKADLVFSSDLHREDSDFPWYHYCCSLSEMALALSSESSCGILTWMVLIYIRWSRRQRK